MSELRSGFFFFGLSLFVIWESLRAGLGTLKEPGSGFLSFCAGLFLLVLSLVLIYRGWGLRESLQSRSRRVVLAVIFLFVYSLVLNTLGFIVATFFLVGILFRLGEPRSWWILLGMSALVTFLAYLVFGVLLHVYFPRGFWGI
jgi:putative tricarboxylic transport membrane protein